jgi:beta-glucanase (GH16 family)
MPRNMDRPRQFEKVPTQPRPGQGGWRHVRIQLPRIPAGIAGALLTWAILVSAPAQGQDIPAWRLLWSDEFNQADGSGPSSTSWSFDIGGNGWGNGELQYYTNRRQNARIEGGHLILEAHAEAYRVGNQWFDYTSARIKTQGRIQSTYGRFEARIQLPSGRGIWPALWMLGANYSTVGWPACGEIDILENIGSEPQRVHASAHGPGFSGTSSRMSTYTLPAGTRFDQAFHLFAVDWEPGAIRASVDNRVYFTLLSQDLTSGETWVFDHPFFIILNLAVGGVWPGPPDATTVFPQRLLIDYLRIYERTTAPVPALQIQRLGSAAQVRWPAVFPNARLLSATALGAPWIDLPISGTIVGDEFVTDLTGPAFLRLRL